MFSRIDENLRWVGVTQPSSRNAPQVGAQVLSLTRNSPHMLRPVLTHLEGVAKYCPATVAGVSAQAVSQE